jgi:hypothetical protein
MYTCVCMHTCTHTHIHVHIHTYMYTVYTICAAPVRVAAQAGVAADGDTLAVTPGVNGYVYTKLYTGRYTWQHSKGES